MNLHTEIIRAAYYMSNWDAALETAQKEGVVHTLYPVKFKIPMVSPNDIGKIAAKLLTEPLNNTGIHYVEGPEMYSSADVAKAFSTALNKAVEAVQTPEEQWIPTLKEMGFSDKAAQSMAFMTKVTFDDNYEKSKTPIRGKTTLNQYIENLVTQANLKT